MLINDVDCSRRPHLATPGSFYYIWLESGMIAAGQTPSTLSPLRQEGELANISFLGLISAESLQLRSDNLPSQSIVAVDRNAGWMSKMVDAVSDAFQERAVGRRSST